MALRQLNTQVLELFAILKAILFHCKFTLFSAHDILLLGLNTVLLQHLCCFNRFLNKESRGKKCKMCRSSNPKRQQSLCEFPGVWGVWAYEMRLNKGMSTLNLTVGVERWDCAHTAHSFTLFGINQKQLCEHVLRRSCEIWQSPLCAFPHTAATAVDSKHLLTLPVFELAV